MIIKHKVGIDATKTVNAELIFEREAQSQGMAIKGCKNDKEAFNASDCIGDWLNNQRNIRFIGAGTSYKNGA